MVRQRGADRQQRIGNGRRGVTAPALILGVVVLLGFAGMALDVAELVISAQQCQRIADAGCLGAAQDLPDYEAATATAASLAQENISEQDQDLFEVTAGMYDPDDPIPNYGPAPAKGAFVVTAQKQVNYVFLPVLGLEGTTVARSAVAAHADVGTCICPMWISEGTYVEYGIQLDLHQCDDPATQSRSYGIFGWLDTPNGVDWDDALKGILDSETEELCRVEAGDTVWNCPGQRTGQWMKALENDWDSRLNRAEWAPWDEDTFENFHYDNPRIMIVPFCTYEGGQGNNAYFTITRFGAWWLEGCQKHGNNKKVWGRFIDFTKPGGIYKGIKPTQLLQ